MLELCVYLHYGIRHQSYVVGNKDLFLKHTWTIGEIIEKGPLSDISKDAVTTLRRESTWIESAELSNDKGCRLGEMSELFSSLLVNAMLA